MLFLLSLFFPVFFLAIADEPVLQLIDIQLDHLVNEESDVEHNVEDYDKDYDPASLDAALNVPDPISEAIEWVRGNHHHAFVDNLLSVDE